jgi:hypothetical protein
VWTTLPTSPDSVRTHSPALKFWLDIIRALNPSEGSVTNIINSTRPEEV